MTEKMTPFSLFVRQALLNPLASPFLPPVEYVLNDFSYANGTKIGTLDVEVIPLVWNTYTQTIFDWNDALILAQYIDADGYTIDETPQNYWRMPTGSELIEALVKAFLETGPPYNGFYADTSYCSSSEISEFEAYFGLNFTAMTLIILGSDLKEAEHTLRCVKI
ncbi:MAG: hypothetical protein WCI04_03315 [archaeon]